MPPVPAADGRALLVEQLDLRSDCARCTGLCCVGLHLVRSADFAIDKPAGAPCPNLRDDFGCGIHARLRESGFPGCVAYDCLGAGQRVTAAVRSAHDGATWRDDPAAARDAFAALPVVTQLHELLWYLAEVMTLPAAAPVHDDARRALDRTAPLAELAPADLLALDVGAVRRDVGPLVDRASALVRDTARRAASRRPPRRDGADTGSRAARGGRHAEGHDRGKPGHAVGHRVPDGSARRRLRPGADLVGADLRGLDLTGSDLRGALLLGADLRDARLDAVDLLGADFRGADARGADLAHALFLTPAQAGAVRRDERTTLPATLHP